MSVRDELKVKLKQKSAESAKKADALLAEEYAALKKATRTDLEAVRPKITDKKTYDALLALIEETSAGNMDLASFQGRIETLGSGAIELAKTVVKLL